MKNKKIFFIIVLVIVCIIAIIFIRNIYINNRNEKIMKNEENQVEVLEKIYSEFLSDSKGKENVSIVLDDSALRNSVTRERLSDSSIERLKALEIKCENPSEVYTLYSSSGRDIIKLTLDNKGGKQIQSYKLYVEKNVLKYEKYGGESIISVY